MGTFATSCNIDPSAKSLRIIDVANVEFNLKRAEK